MGGKAKEFKVELEETILRFGSDLLRLWKKRNGVDEGRLIFVGMANLASFWWCAAKSIIRSRDREVGFFGAYLYDRVVYSYELGYIDRVPEKPEELLDIGDSITFNDVERLLEARAREYSKMSEADILRLRFKDYVATELRFMLRGKLGSKTALPVDPLKIIPIVASKDYARVAEILKSVKEPDLRGWLCEALVAEVYPTIRWGFRWGSYIVIGVPDGITKDFVYEFKCTNSQYMKRYFKPVADAQADLYGYFFKRPRKKVQIFVVESGTIETSEDNVDIAHAEETLRKFAEVDQDISKAKPPAPFKCRPCEYRNKCTLKTLSS